MQEHVMHAKEALKPTRVRHLARLIQDGGHILDQNGSTFPRSHAWGAGAGCPGAERPMAPEGVEEVFETRGSLWACSHIQSSHRGWTCTAEHGVREQAFIMRRMV